MGPGTSGSRWLSLVQCPRSCPLLWIICRALQAAEGKHKVPGPCAGHAALHGSNAQRTVEVQALWSQPCSPGPNECPILKDAAPHRKERW